MKRLFTLIALLACFMGAKADEIVDAQIDFSNYTDISQVPFARWGGSESAFARLSIKDGCLHFESSEAVDPSWTCQFFPIGGIDADPGVTYTLHYKVKGSHKGFISALGFGLTPYGKFPITTEWVEGTIDYKATNADGNILMQCGDWVGFWDLAYMKITHAGKVEPPVEWIEMLANGNAETPWGDLANVRWDDNENNYKICAWAREKGLNVNGSGDWNPFPATIEPEEGNPSNHVFAVHGKAAVESFDNQFFIEAPRRIKPGEKLKLHFRYKASQATKVSTQICYQIPGSYMYFQAIGDINFTPEWKEYDEVIIWPNGGENNGWSIAFNLNVLQKEATDFYFDDLSIQEMKLDHGLFVASSNPATGLEYDFNNARELVWDEDRWAYVATVGTEGNPNSWVDRVMISTVRGNAYAFQIATIKPSSGIIDGTDEVWLLYTESSNTVITLPAAGVWQVAVDDEAMQCNFCLIEGDEIKKPLEEIPNPTEVVVHGKERDAVTGAIWDNQFFIVANRPLRTGEVTIVKFRYKSSIPAHTTTCLYGNPSQYMHWDAIGDVDFTTKWTDFETTLTVPEEADGMKSICFNMAEITDACDYYIKDVIWMTEDHYETLIDVEGIKNFYVKEGENDVIHQFANPQVYTEFDEATGTLTYYYDSQMASRPGITELYTPEDHDAVRFKDYYGKVLKTVIDPSMKNAYLTSTYSMFFGGISQDPFGIYALENMTEIDGLENLNTSAVTDMESMFFGCYSLTMLDLSSFNTSSATNLNGMFLACNKLVLVDISSFDISNVTDMRMMFGGCSKLRTICCFEDWSTTSAQSSNMFISCSSLVGGNGTAFDSNVIDATYARPDGGTESPGYFTADTMTGIESIHNSQFTIHNEEGAAIYNLAGQKMVNDKWSNGKLPRGIYIKDGKKILR